MGRPAKFDRAQALHAAMLLFWERGYAATSISDLTRVMGISPPSLYNSFGDKRSLHEACVELYEQTAVVPPALEAPTAREVFDAILDRAVDLYTRPDRPSGCFVISDPILIERRAAGRAAIVERLRRGQRSGDLGPSVDVEALADFIDTVLRGLSNSARDGVSRQQLQAVADTARRAWPGPDGG